MRKIYLSRAQTRAMSLDHPIGDPTGGAAYGEMNDPISAAVSLYAMGTSAAMVSTSIMAGLTFAGGALSLIGNITGNKTLSKIGAVTGLAGGLGQIGAFGETAKGAQWSDIGIGAGTGAAQTGVNAAGLSQTPVSAGKGAAEAMAAPSTSGTVSMETPSVVGGAGTPAGAMATPSGPAAPATPPSGATAPLNQPAQSFAGGNLAGNAPPSGIWESTKGAAKSVMDFTKEYPGGAVMLGNTASGIADWLTGKTDAEIQELEKRKSLYGAQAAQIQEAIDNERRRRRNLNAGYGAVDTGFKVNAPAPAAPAGLINSARPA